MAQVRRPLNSGQVFDDEYRVGGMFNQPASTPGEPPTVPSTAPYPGPTGDEWIPAKGGESPRERTEGGGAPGTGGGTGSVPRSAWEPQIHAGAGPMGQGLPTFAPMPSPGVSLARPRGMGKLFGSQGGLRGGGLGVPFDPVSNQQSSSIEGLISTLLKKTSNGVF